MLRGLITTRALLLAACTCAFAASLVAAPVSAARPATAHADPGALVGTWKRTLTQADIDRTASFRAEPPGSTPPPPGPMTLAIANGSFTFTDASGFSIGQTTRVDAGGAFDILTYIAPDKGAFCTADEPQNASYTWALDGSDLVLTPADDRCADRNSILGGRWTPAPKTRTLLARQTSSKDSKTGFSWTERLSEAGKPAGKDSGSCTYIGKGKKRATCRSTYHLNDGTLFVRGTVDLTKLFRVPIVGGTGAYAGARGWGTAKPAGTSKTLITLHFA